MSQEKNILLAKKAGYKYIQENVMCYFEELCSEQPTMVLSKVEIKVDEYEGFEEGTKVYYFSSVPIKESSKMSKEAFDWSGGKAQWNVENFSKYVLLPNWNPDKDWNQLIEVATALKIKELPTKIREAYNKVYNLAVHYNE